MPTVFFSGGDGKVRSRVHPDGPIVVAVPAIDASADATPILDVLVDLAAREELVVVYGYHHSSAVCLSPHDIVGALRRRLPTRSFTAVIVDAQPRAQDPECELICYLLNDGAIPIAIAPQGDPAPAAAALAVNLDAATVLELVHDSNLGSRLQSLDMTATPTGSPH